MAEFSKAIREKLGEKKGEKKIKHLEAKSWEDFLDMAIKQASIRTGPSEAKWHVISRKSVEEKGTNTSKPID